MAITNRDLPAGTRLVAKYKGAEHVCIVAASEEGKLAFVVDGKNYSSPSSAGSAVMGGTACNGWRFWTVDGEEPPASEMRSQTKAKKVKASATKLLKRIPGTGLQEGEARYWCLACQKSFVTTEDDPQACPEGHRADDVELTAPAE